MSDERHPGWQRATVVLLVVATMLRLHLLTTIELVPDEAYYWDWSRHLSWGYYDQGPMVAYVIRATTLLFGNTEFGVRFGVCAASLVALVCSYVVAKQMFSPLAGFVTVLAMSVTPLVTVGSLIATYDPLLVCFWALMIVCLYRALFAADHRRQCQAWYWCGVSLGCGFLSKHTMLLAVPCILLFLLISPVHRFWLRRPQPYIALGVALLLYGGVFWWNAQHHWWTFGHLLFLTKKGGSTPPRRLGDFVASQALLLGPGLFLGCLVAMRRAVRTREARQVFLMCLGLPILVFFCLMTWKTRVQANWAPCAWLTPTILWAGWMSEELTRSRVKRSRRAVLAVTTIVLLSGFLTFALLVPEARAMLGVHLTPDKDVTNTAYGWRRLAGHVERMRREMQSGGRRVFVAGNGYQYAALMAFYLPDHPITYDLFLHFRLTMYAAYVADLKRHLGEDCIFINAGEADDSDLRSIFTRVEWQRPFAIWRHPLYAGPIAMIHIAKCYGYRRYVGLTWASGG